MVRHPVTWNMRALPPKNQVPRRMTIMMLSALARVPPRYSQLLRFAIIAACPGHCQHTSRTHLTACL